MSHPLSYRTVNVEKANLGNEIHTRTWMQHVSVISFVNDTSSSSIPITRLIRKWSTFKILIDEPETSFQDRHDGYIDQFSLILRLEFCFTNIFNLLTNDSQFQKPKELFIAMRANTCLERYNVTASEKKHSIRHFPLSTVVINFYWTGFSCIALSQKVFFSAFLVIVVSVLSNLHEKKIHGGFNMQLGLMTRRNNKISSNSTRNDMRAICWRGRQDSCSLSMSHSPYTAKECDGDQKRWSMKIATGIFQVNLSQIGE